MDFGRIMVSPPLVIYLFGTPGQERFWFMWNDLVHGALGAVVLADTRRLETASRRIDFFESRRSPFVVGVNCFDNASGYLVEEVSAAVDLPPPVPIVLCDARSRASVKEVLATLLRHLIRLNTVAGVSASDAPTQRRSLVRGAGAQP